MLKQLNGREVKLEWIGPFPSGDKKVALLIPQYNESTNCGDMERRLEYFRELTSTFKNEMDVILIDDGSSDDSLDRIKDFAGRNRDCFFVASVTPNANKVGALYSTTLAIEHSLIVLSDFDTDLIGIENLFDKIEGLKEDTTLMGGYFRMLPFEGSGNVFFFQQFEYSILRSLYKFHQKEQSVRVMPGAGSCYKREVLVSIFSQHSGLRSGEDRESTLIGLKLGYKTCYINDVLALTRPPLSFRTLVKQRVRWNLGYIETFYKERRYYWTQITRLSRVGLITLADIILVVFTLLLPLIVAVAGIWNVGFLLFLLLGVYTGIIVWGGHLLRQSPQESVEIMNSRVGFIFLFPAFKMAIDYLAWTGAFVRFIKNAKKIKV